ncbi:MAG: shikimate kinase [Bacteroidales bacterium]
MTLVRRIYITGFMGSGKSTAGKKLANSLGWSFLDLDTLVEKEEGESISRIFSIRGEGYFRKRESEILESLKDKPDCVIAVGGGTPCQGKNMDYMLSDGLVIYLKMTPGQLKSRLEKETAHRPLLEGLAGQELLDHITKLLSKREAFYNMANVIVDGFSLDADSFQKKISGLIGI